MQLKQPPPDRRSTSGFTLLEIMIVVALIASLAAILLFSIGGLVGGARERATRATIQKIEALLEDRQRAFDIAFAQNKYTADSALREQFLKQQVPTIHTDLAKKLAKNWVRKEQYKRLFPQSYAEAAANYNLTAPGGHLVETESSELLYFLLFEADVLGIPPAAADAFSASEIADTDNDGRMEFIDSWGQPLRFYRWPTRAIRPGGTGNPYNAGTSLLLFPGLGQDTLTQDPEDPLGTLGRQLGNIYGATFYQDTYHTEHTYHPLLVISAGPDKELGLREPVDVTNGGHLAQPTDDVLLAPLDSVLNDSITNRQGGGF